MQLTKKKQQKKTPPPKKNPQKNKTKANCSVTFFRYIYGRIGCKDSPVGLTW